MLGRGFRFILLDSRRDERSVPFGNGRCSLSASSAGAVIYVSISSGVMRMTGMALGCTGPTTSLGAVVRNPERSLVVSPSLTFLTDVQFVQSPAKTARGLDSSNAKPDIAAVSLAELTE